MVIVIEGRIIVIVERRVVIVVGSRVLIVLETGGVPVMGSVVIVVVILTIRRLTLRVILGVVECFFSHALLQFLID